MGDIHIDLSPMITADVKSAMALEAVKADARQNLAAYISGARSALITNLPGQDMIYLAKEAEAIKWLADPAQDLSGFPLLSAEIEITAPDADQLAQIWVNMSALWRGAAAQLEALRLGIEAAIAAAETVEAVTLAIEGIGA